VADPTAAAATATAATATAATAAAAAATGASSCTSCSTTTLATLAQSEVAAPRVPNGCGGANFNVALSTTTPTPITGAQAGTGCTTQTFGKGVGGCPANYVVISCDLTYYIAKAKT
jgi:hypothetical protein